MTDQFDQLPAPDFEMNTADKTSHPELTPTPVDKRPLIVAVIILVIFIILSIAFGGYLFFHPPTAAVLRDISIILLSFAAVITIFVGMALTLVIVYLALKINDLVQLLNQELLPLMQKANTTAEAASDTAKTVQSKVVVISDEMVKPVMNVLGSVAAAKAITKALFKR